MKLKAELIGGPRDGTIRTTTSEFLLKELESIFDKDFESFSKILLIDDIGTIIIFTPIKDV